MAKDKTTEKLTFTKDQWAKSKKYKHQPDLIAALLDENETYSETEVETILTDYLNKEVK